MRGSTINPWSEADLIRRRSNKAWDWLEDTVTDVSAEQAKWWPPGTANSIGSTYLHVVINTDVEINRLLTGREPLIEPQWVETWGKAYAATPSGLTVGFATATAIGRRRGTTGVRCTLASSDRSTSSPWINCAKPVDMTPVGLGTWPGRDVYHLHGIEHVYFPRRRNRVAQTSPSWNRLGRIRRVPRRRHRRRPARVATRQTASRWNIVGHADTARSPTPITHVDTFWCAWAAFRPDATVLTLDGS